MEFWKKTGHDREPRVSVSSSVFALITDHVWYYFGGQCRSANIFGYIKPQTRAVFGKSYAAEPGQSIKQLAEVEALQEAENILLTIPNTIGVDYNLHLLSSILEHVEPRLGWR